VRFAGLGQAQMAGRGNHVFAAIAEGQGTGFDDPKGVVFVGVTGEVL
jgi:hypothetical protein